MFITGECKKCHGRTVFDICNYTKDKVEKMMQKKDFGHCSVGYHVEIGKMADYYILDWEHKFNTIEEAKRYNKSNI